MEPSLKKQLWDAYQAVGWARKAYRRNKAQRIKYLLEKAREFYQQDWPAAVGVLFEHLKETLGQDKEKLLLEITRIEFSSSTLGVSTWIFRNVL